MLKLSEWAATFDISKAILLAIVAVVASWYDLRGQIELIRQEQTLKWASQEKVDATQNMSIKDIRDDLKDGFKDLKEVVRDNARAINDKR